jgi:hypothetical protein
MKKIGIILLVLLGLSSVNAQYKDSGFHDSDIKNAIIDNSPSSFFGFLKSSNFQMHQTYDFSYSAFGNGQGLALGVLTNSMFYKFSNNLNGQLDISLVHSPYSSLGRDFQNSINGIYVSKAAINYKPWKNTMISIQYRNLPYSYYNPFNPYNSYGFGYDAYDTSNSNSIFIR